MAYSLTPIADMIRLHKYATDGKTSVKSGFSLVELMIVIVIIGVLSAIAVPVYSNNVRKAKQMEADTALSSLRRKLLIYKSEHGLYPKEVHNNYVVGSDWAQVKEGELTGKYFTDSSYTYRSTNRITYKLVCDKGNILQNDRTLDENGDFDWE